MNAPAGVVAILFTDAVSSTRRIDVLGEDRNEELRRAEFALLESAVHSAGGTNLKNGGDGVMAVFQSAVQAVRCAIAIQGAFEGHNAAVLESERLGLRVGLHAGEPAFEHDDVFGGPVVVAQRLCKAAEGGQILASELVHALVGTRGGFNFRAVGSMQLTGFTEPVPACEVLWAPEVPLVRQLTVMLPNRPGALHAITTRLAQAEVRVLGFHAANAGRTGFVQLICTPHDRARDVLVEQLRYYVLESEVLAVRVDDAHPIDAVLTIVAELGLNLGHGYLVPDGDGRMAAVLEFDDPAQRDLAGRRLHEATFVLIASFEPS